MASPLTLMAVHAHPDDESSSTGGILARYGDEGVRTVVVTCTNGEYGDGPDHVKPGDEGHVAEQVAEARLMELAIAGKALGVDHQELLGYHDSGMSDWQYKDRSDVFCNVPVSDVAARLTGLFERYEPQVVVTYSDYSGYNHPDHLYAHHVTMAAVERSQIPAKLYLIARRRRDWEELRRHLEAQGVEMPARPALSPEAQRRMEEVESRITTTIDTSSVAHRKRAALAAHASQLDGSWWLTLPEEAFGTVFGRESFIRAYDTTGAPLPEDDLFAGLR